MTDQTLLGWALLPLVVLVSLYFGRRRAEHHELEVGRIVRVKEQGAPTYEGRIISVHGDVVRLRKICRACHQTSQLESPVEVLSKDVKPA